MRTIAYVRSELMNYFELSEKQQQYADENYLNPLDETYVLNPLENFRDEVLPLSDFIRLDYKSCIHHGYCPLSYFTAYFITLSNDNSQAIVSYRIS